jgi:WD40 repeat protein
MVLPEASSGQAEPAPASDATEIPESTIAATIMHEPAPPTTKVFDDDGTEVPAINLVQPRNLAPEYARRVTAAWQATKSPFQNPRETLNSSSSKTGDPENLLIGTRSLGSVEEKEKRADYELSEVIGEGNMGTVWSARQSSLDREVAVKLPKRVAGGSTLGREQFISEVVVTGRLDHPNIVPIYDMGRDESGQLFYAMKRVEGRPWDAVMHEPDRTRQENVEILMKVCDAIRFAHDRGVIHRDIKPQNIMVGKYGEVSVMDWGIALRLDAVTRSSSVVKLSPAGTPAYMAPEMATANAADIGPHTDVYLLGAVLYEIITREPPHPPPADSHDRLVQQNACLLMAARNVITPATETGELIDIAYKAMATDISKRYQTVDEFQSAIREYFSHAESIALADHGQTHLAHALESRNGVYEDYAKARFAFGEALQLWPENARARNGLDEATIAYADRAYKDGNYGLGISLLDPANELHTDLLKRLKAAKRRADRNRFVAMASAAAAACFLIGGIAVSSFFAIRATRAKNAAILAEKEERKAKEDALFARDEERKAKEREEGAKKEAIAARDAEKLAKEQETLAKNEQIQLKEKAIQAANAEAAAKQRAEHASYHSEIGLAAKHIQRNAFSAAQNILANQAKNEAQTGLRGWEWGHLAYLTKEPSIQPFELNTLARVESVAYSPDQAWVAAGTDKGDVYVWRAAERDKQPSVLAHGAPVSAVAMSDDSRLMASVAGNQVYLWQLPAADSDGRIAPAGTLQYVGEQDGDEKATLLSVDIGPDGDKILTSSTDSKAQIWSRSEPTKAPIILQEHVSGPVWQARFSHDGKQIVTAGHDQTLRIFDLGGPEVRTRRLDGHRGPVYAAEFSPDGKYVISGGRDRRLLAWDLQSSAASQEPREVIQARLATIAEESAETETQFQQLGEHAAAIRAVSFSTDGNILYSASDDNTVRIWNISQGVANLSPVSTLRGHGGWVRSCVAAGDGDKHVLSGSYDGQVFLWNWREYAFPRVLRAASESAISDVRYTSSAASPDAKWIATAAENGEVTVWDMQNLQNPVPHTLREGHDWQATTAAFFNDGSRLLTAGGDNATVVWDARLGNQLFRLGGWNTQGGTGWRGVGAVSQNGRLIATGSDASDDTKTEAVLVKLWDAQTGQLVAALKVPSQDERPEATAIAFAPNDAALFVGDQRGKGYVFTLAEAYPYWTFRGHAAKISAARYLSNGRLVTASSDGTVIKWNVDQQSTRPPRELTLTHRDRVVAMDVSRDERLLITAADTKRDDTALRVWSLVEGGSEESPAEIYKLPKTAFGSTEVRSVAMHPTQSHALVTVFDKSKSAYLVGRWDWASGDQVRTVFTGLRDTSTAFYAPGGDDAILTVGGRGARMRLANQAANQGQMSYRPQTRVQSIAFSADSQLLASAGDDGSIKLWRFDAASGQWVAERKLVGQHQGEVRSVAFHPTASTILLSASADGSAKLWERGAEDWQVVRTFGNGQTAAVNQAIFSPPDANGAVEVLTASDDGTVRIWNAAGELVRQLSHGGAVQCVAMSPNRAWIVAGSGNSAYIWSVNEPKTEADETLTAHFADITSLAFSLDGLRLITAGRDRNVKLWDTTPWGVVADDADESYRGELLTLEGHNDAVTSICIFRNAKYPSIVTAGSDGQAILWPSLDFRAVPVEMVGRR